jgi:hypothetical protein
MSKKDFTTKAKSILSNKGTKPSSMEEFLSDEAPSLSSVVTENQEDGKLENRQIVIEEKAVVGAENARTERYEWRHTPEMNARIQRLLLELNQERRPKKHKIKIVDVIEEAVEAYLKKKGF